MNNPNLIQIMSAEEQRRFSSLSPEDLWETENKYDVAIEQCFGQNRFLLKSQMHALVILNWKRQSEDLQSDIVNLGERKDLLSAFMKSAELYFLPHNLCNISDTSPESYAARLSRCRVIEITGKIDFDKAAALCISYIEQC